MRERGRQSTVTESELDLFQRRMDTSVAIVNFVLTHKLCMMGNLAIAVFLGLNANYINFH